MIKKILFFLLLLLLVIQFNPISKDNPSINEAVALSSATEPLLTAEITTLLRNACYDCHSNSTIYPKYTRFQPLGWWIKGHIKGGRQKLNFDDWGNSSEKQKIKYAQECIEVINEGRMPLKSYTWMHPEGKLSDTENKKLIEFFEKLGG